jgi:replicative DNA helicase
VNDVNDANDVPIGVNGDDAVFAADEPRLRRGVLRLLLTDPTFLASVVDLLDPKAFPTAEERFVADVALSHYRAAGAPIPFDRLLLEVEGAVSSGRITEDQAVAIGVLLRDAPRSPSALAYVRAAAGRILCRQALITAAVDTVRELDDARVPPPTDRLISRFAAALALTEPPIRAPTYRVVADADRWLADLSAAVVPVAGTGIPPLDDACGGGLAAGELGVFLGATGVGKSHLLVACGRAAAAAGRSVLHVSLELSQAQTLARYAAAWAGVRSRDVFDVADAVRQRLSHRAPTGDVRVAAFPNEQITVAQLAAIVDQAVAQDGRVDLLVVDYADLIAPSRRRDSAYEEQGEVYHALRALGRSRGIPVWTASQTNREGVSAKHVDIDLVGDSFRKMQIADLVIAIRRDPVWSSDDRPVLHLTPVKVRSAPQGKGVMVAADYSRSVFVVQDPNAPTLAPSKNGATDWPDPLEVPDGPLGSIGSTGHTSPTRPIGG